MSIAQTLFSLLFMPQSTRCETNFLHVFMENACFLLDKNAISVYYIYVV